MELCFHVMQNPFESIARLQEWGFSILKGPWTKIGHNPTHINPTGDNRLAIAGSGDVLSGLIGALCAKRLSARKACCLATYWHGLAGEKLQQNDSATHLLLALRKTIKHFHLSKNHHSS